MSDPKREQLEAEARDLVFDYEVPAVVAWAERLLAEERKALREIVMSLAIGRIQQTANVSEQAGIKALCGEVLAALDARSSEGKGKP